MMMEKEQTTENEEKMANEKGDLRCGTCSRRFIKVQE
jgi:hypothetical protein